MSPTERAVLNAIRLYHAAPVTQFHPKPDADDPWVEAERAFDRQLSRRRVQQLARRRY